MKYSVPEMSCGHCTAAITKEIVALDPQAKIQTDLDARTVEVETMQSNAAILDAIKSAGYEAAPL